MLAVDASAVAEAARGRSRATLVALDGDRIATGKDFDPATGAGAARRRRACTWTSDGARGLAARLEGRPFGSPGSRRSRTGAGRTRRSSPRTLQQEAGRKLRFSSAQTMRMAQRLYENGYITYMRTDSVNLSETAIAAARAQIAELYGDRFVPPQPRRYTGKVKNAQEAHEAIRPAGDDFRTPGEVADELSTEEFRLYELIWRRTIASQMTDAVGSVGVGADPGASRPPARSATSPRAARPSPTPASSRRTWSPPTTPRPRPRTPSAGCRRWPRTSR